MRPSIEPVIGGSIAEFSQFLHRHLSQAHTAADWETALRRQWMQDPPNHGFILRSEGQIVGGIGALYSLRNLHGRQEKFCNITSWCVLDAFRPQSMRLAMTLIAQKGFHFTDFSPTKTVGASLRFLKFRELDERVAVMLNLPRPLFPGRIIDSPAEIEATLEGTDLQVFCDHAVFPWLRHLLVGDGARWCHVIYKRRSFKGMPCANVLHASNPLIFDRFYPRISTYWLLRGMVSTHAELRTLRRSRWPSAIRSGFNRKVFLSDTLADTDIDYLYSESMAMDL